MQSDINIKRENLWKRFASKVFRDAFVVGEFANSIGAQIFALREREGWTQTELATRAGMAQARISLLESATEENLNLKTLRRIASTFDVALIVRFVPFSELLLSATPASNAWLTPVAFASDAMLFSESPRLRAMDSFAKAVVGAQKQNAAERASDPLSAQPKQAGMISSDVTPHEPLWQRSPKSDAPLQGMRL